MSAASRLPALVCLAACLLAPLARAAPGEGSVDEPVEIDALPYFVRGDTSTSPSSAIDLYDCALDLDESGPERIFRFELPAEARVTAWVEGDIEGLVDLDVHLLDELLIDDMQVASGCLARGHTIAEAQMSAGTRWVVVDSYEGEALAGEFVLRVFAVGEAWSEIPIGEGVVWRGRRFVDEDGPQVLNLIDIDPAVPGVSLEVFDTDMCATVAELAASHSPRPVAAINSSFFTFDAGCTSVSLMKHAGVVSAFNAGDRAAFGLDMQGAPLVDFVGPGDEWPAAWEANGGFGMLVEDGAPTQGDAAWAAQGLTNASFNGPNPRTIIGYRGEGTIFAASVDGRRPNAAGKSLDALAQWSGELGGEGVVNLDGGGSTTMWVDGLTPSGVINYPSDFGQAESTSHAGARAVGGAIFIHADPYNWPPRFQTQPPSTSTAVGELYLYDVDAIDLNVDDVVNYTLLDGPPAMSIDALTGALEYLAAPDDPALAFVTILAFDDQGGEAEQSFELIVEGGRGGDGDGDGDPGDGDGDGDGDSGGSGTGDSGTGGELGADELGAGEGCNCTTGARPRGRAGLLLVLGFGLGLGGARRRRARRD